MTTTIEDDDPLSLTLTGPATVAEGATTTDYAVTLGATGLGAGQSVTFTLDSASGQATEGIDFTALLQAALVAGAGVSLVSGAADANGVITVTATAGAADLAAGATLASFGLATLEDLLVEGPEAFTLQLASGMATVSTPTVTTTITDNDVSPLISDGQSHVSEEGLPGGLPDASGSQLLPSNDSTDLATRDPAGTLDITRNGVAPLTVELINPGLSTVGETSLSWAYDGTNHAVLIGSDATSGEAVIRVTLNNGSIDVGSSGVTVPYGVELLRPIRHSIADLGTAGEDTASLSLTVRISDGVNPVDEGTLTVTVEDDGPSITVSASAPAVASLVVDETDLASDATVSFASSFGNLPLYGADGAGTVVSSTFALGIQSVGVDSGLVDMATGNHIYLYLSGNDVVGRVGSATNTPDAAGVVAFQVSHSDASLTLDQVRAIVHPTTDPNEGRSLGADELITLTRTDTITDQDGDTNTGSNSINLGYAISFKDDGPSITVSASAPAVASLVVDETNLASNATVSFASSFGNLPLYGADGAGTVSSTFALGIQSVGVDSGLVDMATGNHIYLYLSGNDVVGRVGSATNTPDAAGAVAFRVSHSGASLTLDQVRAIVHPTTDPDEGRSLSADELITLTRTDTITDKDGDTNTGSNSINLGHAISFKDDGPSITNVLNADSLTVNEANLPNIATANLVDNFSSSISYGADVAGTTAYALALNGSNVGSGLYALGVGGARGSQILLNQAGNVVTGSVGGTSYFTITFDNLTGEVKFEQKAAIYHSGTGNDTSTLTTAAGALVLRATATDADGDSATHNLDLRGAFNIVDDRPFSTGDDKNAFMPQVNLDETVGVDRYAPAEVSMYPGNTDDGSGWLARVETQISGGFASLFSLSGSYGSDGPGSTTYQPSFTGFTADGLATNLSSTAGGQITLFLEGGVIVGRDADGGSPVFKIEIVNTASSGDPVHQLRTTLYEAIRHGDTTLHDESSPLLTTNGDEVWLTYRVVRKDADGDASPITLETALITTSSSFLTFDDDGPVANSFASGQAVDTSGYLSLVNGNGFGTDGGHVHSIVLEGTTYTWNTSTNTIDFTGGVDRQSVSFTTDHRLVVNFAAGEGQFAVDMDDGRYDLSFNSSGNVGVDVGYTLIDNDSDLASSTLPIDLHVLLGDATDNSLTGSSSNEILIGGQGNDTLTGDLGADVFKWQLGDQATIATPAVDHVVDFDPTEQDALDLRDLLTGEHGTEGADWNLGAYLNFGTEGGKLALLVDPDGAGSGGVTQKIVFDNFSSTTDLGLVLSGYSGATDADLIKKLVEQGNLKLDP
ncbi:DUF5801 repeats-in-toxin domain-containing protein [Malikia sp.]|uniref:DUF5801 repeats-in-toxin domain-containing protein n=1 Tax=Malikia sp. TaxID=2070706 RepID=UPI0026396E1D|nr:DUF5801 repeats-in-toxin domain-containing protein [Malikia sp.]MDD2728998.1 DUF5801 repeats-in-toxin domain-containing protein [Malikia sp.]